MVGGHDWLIHKTLEKFICVDRNEFVFSSTFFYFFPYTNHKRSQINISLPKSLLRWWVGMIHWTLFFLLFFFYFYFCLGLWKSRFWRLQTIFSTCMSPPQTLRKEIYIIPHYQNFSFPYINSPGWTLPYFLLRRDTMVMSYTSVSFWLLIGRSEMRVRFLSVCI